MLTITTTRQQVKTIAQIAARAVNMANKAGIAYTYMDAVMDLESCVSNGCTLDLDRLLAADDFNFSHDVFGIRANINRESGLLENCFSPRFS